ncbi:hypothetical protein VB264_03520 [Arcicella aquatica]|uniref:Glycosyl hydrolase family 32 n=1 Tax=Arcicella aquatica TaxID=217141 RepID=A0ABU5QJD0_9BACT|nr:hypothetical protein [Arcicella aquatica]MEA5256839.1 hypothetical protein [Arcicella aquatica]
MIWEKKGLIYKPDGKFGWNQTHAHVVCADTSFEDKVRIYYSARDQKGRCVASFLDLNPSNLAEVIYVHDKPILELGTAGTFDDCGIMPTWLLHHPNGEKWLYYIGWTVRNTIPYHNSIGIAKSTDGLNFTKLFEGPVIHTIATEPLFNGSCCVLFDKGIFKVWYLNCTHWYGAPDGKLEPCYNIKYAESEDGINWVRQGKIAIDYKDAVEGGISRPSVLIEDGIYKMWYSYRAIDDYRNNVARSYRIGYAESDNGIDWTRLDDQVGIDVSESGWDAQMIEYPLVINHLDKKIMFYNGNGFGASGFGYAEAKL